MVSKIKLYTAFISILICCFFTDISVAGPPEWYVNGYTKSVTKSSHIIGLGNGESHETATDNAFADMLKHIEVSIKSESNNFISSFLDDDIEHIRSQYDSKVKTVTEGGIKGAETIEKSSDDDMHYIMLAISKQQYLDQLMSEIKTKRETIVQMGTDSDGLIEQGKIIPGLGLLMETIDIASEISARLTVYHALGGSRISTEGVLNGQSVISGIRQKLGKLKLIKVSGDNQSANRGQILSEPLIVKSCFISETGREIPLSNIKFKLMDENGKTLDTRFCDDDGIVSFRASAFGKQFGRASIGVNILGLNPVFKRDLRSLSVTFDYGVKNPLTLPLSITIKDERGIPADLVAHSVSNVLQDLGHVVVVDAPLKLKGTIRTEDQREIEGTFGKQFIAKVKMNLELIVTAEGKSIASEVFPSKGIHKLSGEHAIETAYRKMSIPEKRVAKMFADVSSSLRVIVVESSKNAFRVGKEMYEAGNYLEAVRNLKQVTTDGKMVEESKKMIAEIKTMMQQ